jgi:glutathione S-transferase
MSRSPSRAATPYVLHHSPSTAALGVHWLLIELGVPFELVPVDFDRREQKSDAFLKLNPSGHVPVLIVDGAPRTEVAALLILLAERHPEAELAPAPGAPDRAEFLQWMFYLANTAQPAFRAWYYPEESAGPDNVEAVGAQAAAKLDAVWARIDAQLADGRTYLVGGRFSVADMLLTLLARWSRNLPRPAMAWPHLGPYIERMRAIPSLREVHAREGLTDWIDG